MTTIEKAKFFALYYGQEILMYNNSKGEKFWEKQIYPIDAKNLQCDLSIMHLLLKPLSSISEEDAIEVAKHEFSFFKECGGFNLKVIREVSKVSVAAVSEDGKTCLAKIEVNNEYKLNYRGIDFLRSRGYALPWMNYSVEQLVSMGWVVLIEEKG